MSPKTRGAVDGLLVWGGIMVVVIGAVIRTTTGIRVAVFALGAIMLVVGVAHVISFVRPRLGAVRDELRRRREGT